MGGEELCAAVDDGANVEVGLDVAGATVEAGAGAEDVAEGGSNIMPNWVRCDVTTCACVEFTDETKHPSVFHIITTTSQ